VRLQYSLAADRVAALAGMGLYFQELPLLSQCAFDEVRRPNTNGKGAGAVQRFRSEWRFK
jgi:hypothetical protein